MPICVPFWLCYTGVICFLSLPLTHYFKDFSLWLCSARLMHWMANSSAARNITTISILIYRQKTTNQPTNPTTKNHKPNQKTKQTNPQKKLFNQPGLKPGVLLSIFFFLVFRIWCRDALSRYSSLNTSHVCPGVDMNAAVAIWQWHLLWSRVIFLT